ncbi:hypothetical protein Avbf_11091 [Armadillidium vulgare]|nr:hypothetical protein Avbf_11091 [Armadillidium vulgare]
MNERIVSQRIRQSQGQSFTRKAEASIRSSKRYCLNLELLSTLLCKNMGLVGVRLTISPLSEEELNGGDVMRVMCSCTEYQVDAVKSYAHIQEYSLEKILNAITTHDTSLPLVNINSTFDICGVYYEIYLQEKICNKFLNISHLTRAHRARDTLLEDRYSEVIQKETVPASIFTGLRLGFEDT